MTTATREEIDAAVRDARAEEKASEESNRWDFCLADFLKSRLPVVPWVEAHLGGYGIPERADYTTHDASPSPSVEGKGKAGEEGAGHGR